MDVNATPVMLLKDYYSKYTLEHNFPEHSNIFSVGKWIHIYYGLRTLRIQKKRIIKNENVEWACWIFFLLLVNAPSHHFSRFTHFYELGSTFPPEICGMLLFVEDQYYALRGNFVSWISFVVNQTICS